jgi:sugar lactone lactonase YvrE
MSFGTRHDPFMPLRSILFLSLFVSLALRPATGRAADMQYPLSVAATAGGTIYVADLRLPGVWKIADGKRELFFAGSKMYRTPLNAVRCVAVDAKGRLVAGDTATREVYRFDSDGKPQPLTKAGIGMPMAIAFSRQGDILVCDLETPRVVKVPEAGGQPVVVAEVPAPRGIAVDAQDRVWVVSHGKDQVLRILPDGKIETVVSGRPFSFPHTIAIDDDSNAYVCDGYSKTIWKIGAGGKPSKLVEGEPLKGPVGIAWERGRLLVADPQAVGLFSVKPDGAIAPVKFEQ